MSFFTEEDRRLSIEALNTRLKPEDLRALMPNDLSRMVTAVERRDRLYHPLIPEGQIAGFLIDLHGPELLRDREVRKRFVKRAQMPELKACLQYEDPPPIVRGRADSEEYIVNRKWHPGKSWPRAFTQIFGLPVALAGSPDGGLLPAHEDVEPYVPLPDLHDFQRTLQEQVLNVICASAGKNRAILTLPTGAGKTRTVVEALVSGLQQQKLKGRFVLWIAQSDELCEQAITALREVWMDRNVRAAFASPPRRPTPLRLFRLWASREVPDASEEGVIVASIQQLEALCSRKDVLWLRLAEVVGPVIVDEAHHAISPSYTHVLESLGITGRSPSKRPLIGLTATPYRGGADETHRLSRRFNECLLKPDWADPIGKLRRDGILAQMKTQTIPTGRQFNLNPQEEGFVQKFKDLPDSTLQRMGSDRERNALILEKLLEVQKEWPVLFFGCSVAHAQAMALLLRRAGRTAAVVTGETPRSLRRGHIEAFREGQLQFLCNYGVLTTGFDAPQIRVVVIARPTGSVLLYEQMVGRGMRGPANGGKAECLVMDMVDIIPQFGDLMSFDRYSQMWTRQVP